MAEPTLEYLKRQLDSETQSESLVPLATDFYSKLASYAQQLRRSAGSGASEAAVRLTAVQTGLIESMARDLLALRVSKATRKNSVLQLLPEERYVCLAQSKFQRRFDSFVDAVSTGKPSYVELAHRTETERSVTIRFTKHVNELVGLDLKRYGPFEPEDIASIPAASADILIAGGDAVEVHTRDDG